MLNPDLRKLLSNHLSRYSLVTATAKRARIIAEELEEKKQSTTEKSVSIAVEEILRGDYIIVEPEEIRNL